MTRRKILAPIPKDVYDQTPLTRNVALGIFKSLEAQAAEFHFEEAKVYLEVEYSTGTRPPGRIHVYPERAKIVHSADPFELDAELYRSESPQPQKPRQVRWIAVNLAEGDRLVIRPKEDAPEYLFNYLAGSYLEIEAPLNSVTSGLPFVPHFESMMDKSGGILWRYDVELWRGEKKLFWVDPAVYLEGEYNR